MPHSTLEDNKSPSPVQDEEELPDALPSEEGSPSLRKKEVGQKKEVKLEDIFDDEESDEEFASSAVTKNNVESSPPSAPVYGLTHP